AARRHCASLTLKCGSTVANTSKDCCQVAIRSKKPCLSSCISLLYASGKPFNTCKIATRWPSTRPVLPRSNSNTSGFFFCGISDEPELIASPSLKKPASPEQKKITSSDKRDKCVIQILAAADSSTT